jgi:hypothetical protein
MTASVIEFPKRPRSQPSEAPAPLRDEMRSLLERMLTYAISDDEREQRDTALDRGSWMQRLEAAGIYEHLDDDARSAVIGDRCRDELPLRRVKAWHALRFPKRGEAQKGAPWFFVCGPVGTGKSTAAGWTLARSPGLYVTMTMLLADYATWKRGFGEERNRGRFASYRRASMLVLDEVGTETDAELAREAVFALVDARQSRRMSTLVLTNMTKPEIVSAIKAGRYDKRAADRLRALAMVIDLGDLPSLRKSVPGGGL